MLFDYSPEILERFPTIRAGIIHATGLRNGPADTDLTAAYSAEQAAVVARIGDTPLAELPSVAAWRRTFSGFGVKPTQYRSAIESLLRRLTKKGDIPSISTLVDIGNLVSIRHALPIAFIDLAGVGGTTEVVFATGEERFRDLGSSDSIHPEPGEVVFVDEAGLVSARRWCWRQSAESATGPTTTDVLVTIEGHHDSAATDVAAAVDDLVDLLGLHQPQATIQSTATFAPLAGWTT
ncbi:MAG: phenylalanine--tRNA ligase beta subunit-related protein [Acidimicrobiia bacterium]|nr:phenylalanine--tRNA ligase beta subunit-related protein [Acidimicrobiia bacterium]